MCCEDRICSKHEPEKDKQHLDRLLVHLRDGCNRSEIAVLRPCDHDLRIVAAKGACYSWFAIKSLYFLSNGPEPYQSRSVNEVMVLANELDLANPNHARFIVLTL
jgi:hypothetical protein